MGVRIVTDSTAYLPEDLKAQYHIEVVSLNVILDEKSYREIDLTNEEFYPKMEKAKNMPTSSQPSMEELQEVFADIAQKGDDILAIFLSSKLSGTVTSAGPLAAQMVMNNYPQRRIEVFDALTTGMQQGFIAPFKRAGIGANPFKTRGIICCSCKTTAGAYIFCTDSGQPAAE